VIAESNEKKTQEQPQRVIAESNEKRTKVSSQKKSQEETPKKTPKKTPEKPEYVKTKEGKIVVEEHAQPDYVLSLKDATAASLKWGLAAAGKQALSLPIKMKDYLLVYRLLEGEVSPNQLTLFHWDYIHQTIGADQIWFRGRSSKWEIDDFKRRNCYCLRCGTNIGAHDVQSYCNGAVCHKREMWVEGTKYY